MKRVKRPKSCPGEEYTSIELIPKLDKLAVSPQAKAAWLARRNLAIGGTPR